MRNGVLPLAKDRNVAPALCLRNRFSDLEHEEPGNMELGSSEHGNLEARNMEPGSPEHGNLEPRNPKHGNLEPRNPKHGNLKPGNTMVEPGTLEAEVSNLDLGHNTQHDLLRFTGSVAGKEAVFLVDSGSTHDFLSSKFVEKHQLQTHSMDTEFSVNLADGSTNTSGVLTRTPPLLTKLGEFTERQCFVVFPLAKYDVILGKPWLTRNTPFIDFRTNKIGRESDHATSGTSDAELDPVGEPLRLPTELSEVELNFISGKQARHDLRKVNLVSLLG